MKEMDFTGRWRIVEAPDMIEGYLDETPDPYIQINVESKDKVDGEYQFATQDGNIDGGFETDKEGNLRLSFSFEGSDEMTEVSGCGVATLESPDTLLLKMHYHMGDTSTYICKRN